MRNSLIKSGLAAVLVLGSTLAIAKPKPVAKPAWSGSFQLMFMTMSTNYAGQSNVMKMLNCSYSAPQKAPSGASGTLAVPAGMTLKSPLPFQITNDQGGAAAAGKTETKHYWMSSPTIPKGQPEIAKGGGTAGQTVTWDVGSSGAVNTQGHFASPTQYFLGDDAKVAGPYDAKISYIGDIHLDMTDKQQFLGPVTVTAPADAGAVNTGAAMDISWTPVPNVVGYTVMVSGADAAGKTKVCYWENAYGALSSVYTLGAQGALKAGKLVAPDKTHVQIPAGIFTGPVSVSITGYSVEVKGKGPLNPWGWAQTMTSLQLGPTAGQ